jgi:5-formyltetrahydrofolate cyclo-ligase
MNVCSEKQALRASIRAQILAMSPADRLVQEAILRTRLLDLPGLERALTVLGYVPAFPEEINTWPILRDLSSLGKSIVCPRVEPTSRRLRLFLISHLDSDLKPGRFGIPEPQSCCREVASDLIDWVLVPGLAFDRRGFRLGRGAGYYDRFLADLPPDRPRWAIAYTTQIVAQVPIEPHDQPIDGIATAEGLHETPRRPSGDL